MNLAQINQQLIYSFNSEADLVKAIEKVSHNFTQKREDLAQYLKDPRLVSAYTSFYLSTNLPKLAAVFNYLDKNFQDYADYEVIDIGSGPGTFMLSILEKLPSVKVCGIETAELMREQAKRLIEFAYPRANYHLYAGVNEVEKRTQKRLGIFSHSANEMEVSEVLNYIKKLELDEVLFVEPGTKDFFSKSLELRSQLQAKGYQIQYPCPSNAACPLSENDWCHQFIKVSLPEDVQRLCQLVKKDRSLLPLTIHFYTKEESLAAQAINRIIRTYAPSKFAVEMEVCTMAGDENRVKKLQQLTRKLKKSEIKALAKIKAGQKIKFKVEKEMAPGFMRGEFYES